MSNIGILCFCIDLCLHANFLDPLEVISLYCSPSIKIQTNLTLISTRLFLNVCLHVKSPCPKPWKLLKLPSLILCQWWWYFWWREWTLALSCSSKAPLPLTQYNLTVWHFYNLTLRVNRPLTWTAVIVFFQLVNGQE